MKYRLGFGDHVPRLLCGDDKYEAYLEKLSRYGYPVYEEYGQIPLHSTDERIHEECGVSRETISE